jgi:hypothetical protein
MSEQRAKKLAADILRTATVMQIKQDALQAAAKLVLVRPARSKRAVMVVPERFIGRVSRYLVSRRC